MRVLVTGATGFIGRHLVHQLVREGLDVIILAEESEVRTQAFPSLIDEVRSQLETVYGDLRNFALTSRAVVNAAPDVVVHLAAKGVTNPFLEVNLAIRHNLQGTINLLRACFDSSRLARKPVNCVVARTPGELTTMNVYAASKAAAWLFCKMYVRTHQWPIQGAMFFQVYGPDQPSHTLVQAAMRAALAGEDFAMTSGIQERDWIYIDDLVDGLLAYVRSDPQPGTSLDFGTGRLTSVVDVVKKIYRVAGAGGRPLIGALPDRPGEETCQVADVAMTYKHIGWRARITLDEGIRLLLHQISS